MTNQSLKTITIVHVVLCSIFIAVQWMMFSVNALVGLFGSPLLIIWCIIAHMLSVNPYMHLLASTGIAILIAYLPFVCTLLEIRIWQG